MPDQGRSPSRTPYHRRDCCWEARATAQAWAEEWESLTDEERGARNDALYRAIKEADDA